jgi:sugar transferase (PEP-CTERM system associated)
MVRILNIYFPARTLILGISEGCLISFAFLVAAIARLGPRTAGRMLNYQHGSLKILVVSAAIITCMYYFDLYDSMILGNRREVLIRLVQMLGTVYTVSVFLYYLYPPLQLGRGIFVIGLFFVATLLFVWRKLFFVVNNVEAFADRAILVGESSLADDLKREFESRPELGLRFVGQVLEDGPEINHADEPGKEVSVHSLDADMGENLCRTVKLLRANRIVVTMAERRGKLPVERLLSLKCRGVHVQDGVELYETITGKVPIESVRLASLLFSPGCYASRFHLFYKRFASIVVSVTGLILSLPLFPFILAAIKLTSRGPILYRQSRVGRDGVVFHCYKFRTMRADAEADSGPTWAKDDDPRITPVGKFLRKSRLDEIPQLWNVLRGDMSLVGPRPERPEFVEKLGREIPFYQLRHNVRPGISGWAQVRYQYGSSVEDAKEKLRYDLYYIKNMSAGLDLLICFSTIKIILLGRGAK